MKWLGKINFDNRPQYDTEGLITESEVDTISGSLNTKISAKPDTLINLSDTPAAYDTGKYLKSTTDGAEWATVSGGTGTSAHSELTELDYASAGHTGFAETSHSHTESDIIDLDKYTESEVDTISGSLQTNIDGKANTSHTHTEANITDLDKYTQSEVDTISGTLSAEIDSDISIHTSNADAHHNESHTIASHSDTSGTGAELDILTDGSETSLHIHDGRYYTESEVDTISGSLNTKIDAKMTDLSDDTTPELGGQLVVGENDIKYDALLSADGKYSGNTRDGVLGATIAFGNLVYLNTTDQRWELADADAEATSGDVDLAIVLAAGNDGDTRLLLIDGYVREDDWNFTSYGQALFVSVTAGDMTQTVVSGSGDIVRIVGKAGTTADQIRFKPSESWVELS